MSLRNSPSQFVKSSNFVVVQRTEEYSQSAPSALIQWVGKSLVRLAEDSALRVLEALPVLRFLFRQRRLVLVACERRRVRESELVCHFGEVELKYGIVFRSETLNFLQRPLAKLCVCDKIDAFDFIVTVTLLSRNCPTLW